MDHGSAGRTAQGSEETQVGGRGYEDKSDRIRRISVRRDDVWGVYNKKEGNRGPREKERTVRKEIRRSLGILQCRGFRHGSKYDTEGLFCGDRGLDWGRIHPPATASSP